MTAQHRGPHTAQPAQMQLPFLPAHGPVWRNLSPAELIEMSIARGEGYLAANGALVVKTGSRTGRSPSDRFIVNDPQTDALIGWNKINQPLPAERYDRLKRRAQAYAQRRELFVFDGFAGADPRFSLPVRIITEKCWHSLFAHTLFRRPSPKDLLDFQPQMTLINLCGFKAIPEMDGTKTEACIAVHFGQREVLIVGTEYAGETKKSVFSYLNFILPAQDVFPMHCSANVGDKGDTALFFGLSGTGKTTLSADPRRRLIGDDEHGWSDQGIFNFEGGCYAKTIRLSKEGEPQIWNAIRFGSVLENVIVDPTTRLPNYDSDAITENTRVTYPVEFIENCELSGCASHPNNVVFLTCDAFGVLPPISRLDHEQAVEQFLLGYTAKVAGTEAGVTEPTATFSTCFGAPFMPLPAKRYAELLKQKLARHGSQVWLVNTGWSGGSATSGAPRMKLAFTRAMLDAALSGALNGVEYAPDPIFRLSVPRHCPQVPEDILDARRSWRHPEQYDEAAQRLAGMFREQLQKILG